MPCEACQQSERDDAERDEICHAFAEEEYPLAIKPGVVRPILSENWSEKRFGQAVDYLSKNVQRWFGIYHQVTELPVSRSDLFSSIRPSELLVYDEDFGKAGWTAETWHSIRCRLLTLQAKVEAGGRSRFLVAIAPDKSSAYAAYLPLRVQMRNSFEEIAKAPSLHFPRLDLAIKASIAEGTQDVYLPNDSHWGSVGSKIAAITVVDYMNQASALALVRGH
jgi:SGNH hydrolase-like domain, acetyltransferase AlgX